MTPSDGSGFSRTWLRLAEAAGVLWLVAAIPFFTDAAVNVFVLTLLGLCGIAIGAAWLILSAWNPYLLLKPPFRRHWLIVPAAGALGLVLLFTDYGLMLRVALSETALEHSLEAVSAGRVPRVSRLMALAIRFDQLIHSGEIADFAELAELGQVSRARVSQIMNLLMLAPDIKEAILFLPRTPRGRDPIHLRMLQPIALQPDWRKQRQKWNELSIDFAGRP
jgi:hypothetical protein